MSGELVSLDLVKAIDLAITDSLLHTPDQPLVPVNAVTGNVIRASGISPDRWQQVLQLVCERSLKRSCALYFGAEAA